MQLVNPCWVWIREFAVGCGVCLCEVTVWTVTHTAMQGHTFVPWSCDCMGPWNWSSGRRNWLHGGRLILWGSAGACVLKLQWPLLVIGYVR